MNETTQPEPPTAMHGVTILRRLAHILRQSDRPDIVLPRIADHLVDALGTTNPIAVSVRLGNDEYQTPRYEDATRSTRAAFTTAQGAEGNITVAHLGDRRIDRSHAIHTMESTVLDAAAEMVCARLEQVSELEDLREARRSLEEEVLARATDLRRLASGLTLAEEKERREIASDLHDHIGQALAFIKIRMRELQGNAVFAGFEDTIGEVLRLLDQTIRYTRDLTGEISPPVLYELGLGAGLDWLAEHFTVKRKFQVKLHASGRPRALPNDLTVMLFKSVRELLMNSLKHSGAPHAEVDVHWRDGMVSVTVSDDGRGFDPAAQAHAHHDGFGLFSIRERIRDLGGSVAMVSAPRRGCRTTLEVPFGGGKP
ncbi:MAG: sensor histidine kinase [Candidatus Eisenbacteria bacterium]|uniref:Sensor histidine kinase n=1 Tax=Eiseniibacteriota bacterium TaxID=2212470 RepID=A0A956LX20_UNCEI|nr:sensor histidine kinase [Candidatus Eisenbacteria bacterium]